MVRRRDAAHIRQGRPLLDAFLIMLFVAIVAALSSRTLLLQQFDWGIYDTLLELLPLPDNIDIPLVIAIDERSLASVGPWPWRRSAYAKAVNTLTLAGVERIGIDILMTDGLMTEAQTTEGNQNTETDDEQLAAAIAAAHSVYMPLAIDEQQSGGQLLEVLPGTRFIEAGAHLGHVHLEADDDGVVRGVYLWQGIDQPYWPHLALAMTGAKPGSHGESSEPSARSSASTHARRHMSMANARSEYRLLKFVRGSGALPRISFIDLLNGRVPARQLRGRTVLIGMTAAAGADTIATPVTRAGRPMPGVEFNANLYGAIRANGLIELLSTGATVALSTLLAMLPVMFLPFLRPRPALLVALAFSAAPVVLSLMLLAWQNLWFAPTAALVGSLLTYPLWSWRRLDQTLRSVSEEVVHLHQTTDQTRLGSNTPDRAAAARFIQAVLPETSSNLAPSAHADAQVRQWLNSFSALAATPQPEVNDSFEVLTRGLDALHSSIALQTDALGAAQRSLDGMSDGVVLLGTFGQILFANSAARALLSINTDAPCDSLDTLAVLASLRLEQNPIQQHPQRPITRSLPYPLAPPYTLSPPYKWPMLMRALYLRPVGSADAEVWHITLEAKAHDRQEVLVTLSRVVAGALITLVDISALRQAERTHRETLSFLSHDLRSPIVSLLALSGSLRDRHTDPDVQDSLERIQRYAQRSLENAEQFLQMTRIENEPTMTRYELDLLAAAENAAAQLSDQAATLGGRIEVTTDTNEGVWVLGSGEFIERAILNLISNALKYGAAADCIRVHVLEDGDDAICEVHDNGPGIPAHEVPNLFNPYYQRPEHRGRRDGVGLGLRFVQVVAQRHNGRIDVHSAPGKGSTFRLILPRLAMDVGMD